MVPLRKTTLHIEKEGRKVAPYGIRNPLYNKGVDQLPNVPRNRMDVQMDKLGLSKVLNFCYPAGLAGAMMNGFSPCGII